MGLFEPPPLAGANASDSTRGVGIARPLPDELQARIPPKSSRPSRAAAPTHRGPGSLGTAEFTGARRDSWPWRPEASRPRIPESDGRGRPAHLHHPGDGEAPGPALRSRCRRCLKGAGWFGGRTSLQERPTSDQLPARTTRGSQRTPISTSAQFMQTLGRQAHSWRLVPSTISEPTGRSQLLARSLSCTHQILPPSRHQPRGEVTDTRRVADGKATLRR